VHLARKKKQKKKIVGLSSSIITSILAGFLLIICTSCLHPKPTLAIIRHYKLDNTLCPYYQANIVTHIKFELQRKKKMFSIFVSDAIDNLVYQLSRCRLFLTV
jgi:hypothetical protein